jgi:hypothetical protein
MILGAVLLSDRKFYSWNVALPALIASPVVDAIYLNIQTSQPDLYQPVEDLLEGSGKPFFIDYWDIYWSSFRTAPTYNQDPRRLTGIVIARNMALDEALNPKYSHILFVDSDVRPHPGSIEKVIALKKSVAGGYVPGRGAHSHVHYVFAVIARYNAIVNCVHGTCGFMLIDRHVYEVIRFRAGPHPQKRDKWLSEDPCFAADARAAGLMDGWWIDTTATADHVDDPDNPLKLEEAANGYTARL